jgi:hypothetical protein
VGADGVHRVNRVADPDQHEVVGAGPGLGGRRLGQRVRSSRRRYRAGSTSSRRHGRHAADHVPVTYTTSPPM